MMISDSEIFLRCLEFVREQSGGEWGDEIERKDARKMAEFVTALAKDIVA